MLGEDYFSLLNNKNHEEVEKTVQNLAENNVRESIPALLELLVTTENHNLRNDVALALSDMKAQSAVNPLIQMIKDPKTEGYRGTLVYALQELDYSEHMDFIFSLLVTGNLEVSRNAYCLIEKVLEKDNKDIDLIKKQIPLITNKICDLQYDINFYINALDLLSK